MQLAARERQRKVALAATVERAAAAQHLAGVVDHPRAECRHERLDLGRLQRIVPAHGRLRTQQVAAVVHGDPHARKLVCRASGDRCYPLRVGEPLGEVHDPQPFGPPQALGGQPRIDGLAFSRASGDVALRLLEGRVAAVARRHQVEAGPPHDGQVAGRREVEGPRVVGLHEGPLRAAREAGQLVSPGP